MVTGAVSRKLKSAAVRAVENAGKTAADGIGLVLEKNSDCGDVYVINFHKMKITGRARTVGEKSEGKSQGFDGETHIRHGGESSS